MDPKAGAPSSGATLRRPVQIVKKRSGPLEGALDELNRIDSAAATTVTATAPGPAASRVASPPEPEPRLGAASPPAAKRRGTIKEKKRERWLLTRKTWKYMTDAGRKLIPENAQNRKEDIPKIEAHFQSVCAAEPRFVLWRRKSSYPGAMRNSRRRLKQLLHHTGHPKQPPTAEALELEEARNADQMIEMLQSYLKLDEAMKTTTLLGAKTVRPDQTMSPSAQRPDRGRSARPSAGVEPNDEVARLLELLRKLSQSATLPNVRIAPQQITADLLQDKVWLKQVYNSLKKQQLHRILSRHSTEFPAKQLRHASSLSSLFGGIPGGQEYGRDAAASLRVPPPSRPGPSAAAPPPSSTSTTMTVTLRTRKPPPDTLDLPMAAGRSPLKSGPLKSGPASPASPSSRESSSSTTPTTIKTKTPTKSPRRPKAPAPAAPEKQYNSCGTQTNFIQLQEIKRVAEEYRQRQREEAAAKSPLATTPGATDDEADKLSAAPGGHHHRRKSSIDNEDVSQSVSDTIKRYLRMARKKSVHDDNANRFKRVNYDQNLRNIRAQGEPNPPGMDEDNSKAVQTLDAWAVITLEFIRGCESSSSLDSAHAEWQRQLDERLQKKREFDEKHGLACSPVGDEAYQASKPSVSSCSSSSAPTSPTQAQGGGGILHTSSQFLSNLWHGASNANDLPQSAADLHSAAAMQKSKSSSNVGQFVSRKILKSRSKSQTRQSGQPAATPLSNAKWSPSDQLTWTSDKGDTYHVEDTNLLNLSDVEANILHLVAIDKINELNIGLTLTDDRNIKLHKRRVLPKKKAITTSFFDIGKKDASGGNANLFGNSLETCVVNDKKRAFNRKAASLERGSRNSISSLFRSSISGSASSSARDASKLNDNVRSYESLPSGSLASNSNNNILSNLHFGNLAKSSSTHMSRSQSDIRRKSQDLDSSGYELPDDLPDASTELQVPLFVNLCIKYLEENGLHMIGLFRVSTSKKRVKQMREEFDKSAVSHFEANTCPHDVATLLKEFLRDLPDPLLCSHLYKAFLQTQRIRNRRLQLEAIGHLVKLLPSTHRDTLYVLLKFLARVAASSDDASNEDGSLQMSGNKMDSNNLATVFAPNILRGDPSCVGSSGVSEQESMNDAINVIRIMIDHYEELFRVPADLLDSVYSHMLDACPEQLYTLCNQRKTQVREDTAAPQPSKAADGKEAIESEQPPKRLYSRKSVMHDNDASTAPNALVNGTSASKRLTHNLRSKDEPKDRRQSSPNVLDKSGVVSGSLQIPMHLNQTTSSDPLENIDDVFYRNAPASPFSKSSKFEFSDIPYIEDVSVQDMEIINECFPISGSLSFSTKPSAVGGDVAAQQTVGPNVYVGNFESGPVASRNLREPKLPTSITNIGGEIMRSKTADFEKMCAKNSPQSQPQQSQAQAAPSDTRARVNPPRTKVYKRQELIQSAKHVYESKK